MGWSQNLFRVLWRALSKEVKEQVGTDLFGNKYYYIPEYKNWRGCGRAGPGAMAHGPSPSAACGILPDQGTKPRPLHRQADSQPLRHQGSPLLMLLRQTIREKRIVESANKREIDYEVGDIPAEWEGVFFWFWYQGDDGFIECLWECSLLFSLLEEFEKTQSWIRKTRKTPPTMEN
ncbi:NADH dehydrogenase [ubiquinone] 1 alpha subcomplex assembly factor 2 isoform X1 [Tursiops truncatus]|uniref:NADH dehydrogenase [ubiquinone] 1 alpha subcomplex assembly factor 2 isoform X1 n=1 Tax=Tursiops truncatus TaxID=9739 RepID=UPI003CCFDF98